MLRTTTLGLLAFISIASIAEAQRPVYRPTDAQEKRWTARFSANSLFGVSLRISNLGNLPLPPARILSNGATVFFYNDGTIQLPEGRTTTSEFIFSPSNQTIIPGDDILGVRPGGTINEFTLNRYGAVGLGNTQEISGSGQSGWDLAYKYEWGKAANRLRFGVTWGFGINNLDFESNETVTSDLRVASDTFQLSIPLEVTDTELFVGSSDNPRTIAIGFDADAFNAIQGDPVDFIDPRTGLNVRATAPAEVSTEFDGVVAFARIGPSFSLRLIDELYLELSAGFVAAYLDSQISQRVTINDGLPFQFPDLNFNENVNYNQTLFGYYIEGLLRYQWTRRVGLQASFMQMGFSEPDPIEINGATYELDFSTPSLGSAGISIVF